nr:unnamed protein product [Callosobruchus analis]
MTKYVKPNIYGSKFTRFQQRLEFWITYISAISKPAQFEDEYINRKSFASINVLATFNAQEKFTSVDVQWPKNM